MRSEFKNKVEWVTIEPGEYFTSNEKIIISTLLGSCVSACLWDPVHKIAGMNHFLLSSRRYKKNTPVCVSEAGRYGVHAMELVINDMLQLGASRKYLNAKVFGGGNVLNGTVSDSNFFCVGDINIRFIKEFLDTEKIPIISSDLGGDNGRIVRFDTNTYNVFIRKIRKTDAMPIENRDLNFWKKSLNEQEVEEASNKNVDLW
jgi:chemotaxis protein CheD